jgi:hypothetical protein
MVLRLIGVVDVEITIRKAGTLNLGAGGRDSFVKQLGFFSGIARCLSLKSAEIHDVLSGRHRKYHAVGVDRHASIVRNTVAVRRERGTDQPAEGPRRAVAISQHAAL